MTKQPWYKRLPWIRLVITVIALLVIAFCLGLIIYGSNSTTSDIALGILAGITAAFALSQWFFPFSPKQYEASKLPLARELVRGSFKMGDESAANFPYIKTPIEDAYNTANQALLVAKTGKGDKHGVLILGEANAGKTRLALEVLIQALPGWPVLRWRPDYTLDKIPSKTFLIGNSLAIFIDDLQDYVSIQMKDIEGKVLATDPRTTTLRTLLETSFQEVRHVVVVATCRLEDEERVRAGLDQLFTELVVIPLPHFSADIHDSQASEIVTKFQRYGATHIEDWDGTLGSLVLGLSRRNQEYLKMRNDTAATILRAMKLLWSAGILVHTEQSLRAVCTDVFGDKALLTDEKTWQEAVNQLVQKQFVTEEVEQNRREVTLVIRKDTYFDQVITDYPTPNRPHQLIQHLVLLVNVLVVLRDAQSLVSVGLALDELKHNEEALIAYEQAIHLDLNNSRAYVAKGLTLYELKRYEEAIANFDQFLCLAPTNPRHAYFAYWWKGKALEKLTRNEEALVAYEQAAILNPMLLKSMKK